MDIEIRLPIRFKYYEENLIKRAKYYGYNIFEKNDPFYNDVCSKFTYDNMDISLSERQNLLNLTGKNLCIPGCNYSNFDIDNMKSICKCKIIQIVLLIILYQTIIKIKMKMKMN